MLFSKQGMAALLLLVISGLVIAKPTVDYCATCQSVSEFMHEMVQNQTESIMKTNLYKMCLKENDGANSRVVSNRSVHTDDRHFEIFIFVHVIVLITIRWL